MSILRDFRDSPITFECDQCGGECDTGEENFNEALAYFKQEGGVVKKIGDEWMHFCSWDCFKEHGE